VKEKDDLTIILPNMVVDEIIISLILVVSTLRKVVFRDFTYFDTSSVLAQPIRHNNHYPYIGNTEYTTRCCLYPMNLPQNGLAHKVHYEQDLYPVVIHTRFGNAGPVIVVTMLSPEYPRDLVIHFA